MAVKNDMEGKQQLIGEVLGVYSYLQATFLGPQSRHQPPLLSNSPVIGTLSSQNHNGS